MLEKEEGLLEDPGLLETKVPGLLEKEEPGLLETEEGVLENKRGFG